MIVRTHQLYNGTLPNPGSYDVLATVPPGVRWLVKWVSISNSSSAPATVALVIDSGTFNFGTLYTEAAVPVGVLRTVSCYAVLNEGDDLGAYTDAAGGNGVQLHLGGIIFDL